MENKLFHFIQAQSVHSSEIDQVISTESDKIVGLFVWGHQCPNCEIAKRVLTDRKEELHQFNIKWLQSNTYEDFDMATKFGIHGIPTFFFFYRGKKLGRISPFPGWEAFSEALRQLNERINH